jgi:hypothetical protein
VRCARLGTISRPPGELISLTRQNKYHLAAPAATSTSLIHFSLARACIIFSKQKTTALRKNERVSEQKRHTQTRFARTTATKDLMGSGFLLLAEREIIFHAAPHEFITQLLPP